DRRSDREEQRSRLLGPRGDVVVSTRATVPKSPARSSGRKLDRHLFFWLLPRARHRAADATLPWQQLVTSANQVPIAEDAVDAPHGWPELGGTDEVCREGSELA